MNKIGFDATRGEKFISKNVPSKLLARAKTAFIIETVKATSSAGGVSTKTKRNRACKGRPRSGGHGPGHHGQSLSVGPSMVQAVATPSLPASLPTGDFCPRSKMLHNSPDRRWPRGHSLTSLQPRVMSRFRYFGNMSGDFCVC